MKRKAEHPEPQAANGLGKKPKPAVEATTDLRARFRHDLFSSRIVEDYRVQYASSTPYNHAVISNLIEDTLLRSVRSEIADNLHFTPKETDIYKIHQSGDLANLDGLPASALERLPSLLRLRDALYSRDFRQWISDVSGAGPVSGKKTDMAVNVYVPGCHLLCHDDVIGSRRVSYILYLTQPDRPWQAEWGGALRLYPTNAVKDDEGRVCKIPQPEWTKTIPPAWNQLSFFAVQPGESFHDVEEVYKPAQGVDEDDGGRLRMAISGWFHIPQEGEEGFEPGLEEKMAEKSSLQQLQGTADQLDVPRIEWTDPEANDLLAQSGTLDAVAELSEKDLEFLLQFMTPNYLTPDIVEELSELFADESMLQLTDFLNKKFADSLRKCFGTSENPTLRRFGTSSPPYKHRYQYLAPTRTALPHSPSDDNPFERLLDDFLPSLAFRKWLSLATGLTLKRCFILARRFRRGLDYQLAQSYDGEDPQLEYTLSLTPSLGWGASDDEGEAADGERSRGGTEKESADENENVGGYELYMAGDDDDDDDDEDGGGSDAGVNIPANIQSNTGAGTRRLAKTKKADPAVYRAAGDDEDDGILFSNPASWNTLSIVLRDKGTLKFVKYVSQAAKGDRWDFTGCVQVDDDDDSDVEAEADADN